MKRPALMIALMALLIAAPGAFAQSRTDFEQLPTTMDPTGCPTGDRSGRQPWYDPNEVDPRNQTGCNAGESIGKCLKRMHGLD